jgi:methylamine dehydrogenase accessory protein MauD
VPFEASWRRRTATIEATGAVTTFLLISSIVLWVFVLLLAFLLLGALRNQGLLSWQVEQLKATAPTRLGRSGLRLGKKAPDFTLLSIAGGEVSLHDFGGRKVLLVFTQTACSPCRAVMPELNRLPDDGLQVLVVNNGDIKRTRAWAAEVSPRFPILVQEGPSLSRRYEVFATPFAFLINEQGVIVSKGIVNTGQHIRFVLSGAGQKGQPAEDELAEDEAGEPEPAMPAATMNEEAAG